ncbi:HEAT repeat-containing protein [Lentzea waywayandensis]|uniref:HEAT repeat-containing protein n=1 Tax=Lentzea waywayandensis TaxID=84724 RepID=A0A1I6FHY1_9PSEU|nr:HEAT repeat domain-containing protein [Lentzea waywayandensis]SFR29549.1 HEAT repeat-containing protein [Lentzea waywayandensis]
MGIAKARRIARRAHQGQLTDDGGLFLDHLERVARAVEERGGGWAAQQAAWLYAVPATGVDLVREGVPWRVVRVVEALRCAPGWSPPASARVRHDEELVREVLDADKRRAWPKSSPGPVEPLDASMLPKLLADYRREAGPDTHRMIYGVLSTPTGLTTPAVAEIAEQWWDSENDWEAAVAVLAARGAGLLDRERLLHKAAEGGPHAAKLAIENLRGEGTPDEVEVLGSIVRRPEPQWRWLRADAAARLTAIGGAAAEAALRERAFTPLDPPWRNDRSWLHRNAASVTPRLIEALSDPEWKHEAPLALGLLRAVEAVGPLCESARTDELPVQQIQALGRIGSPEAGPTLVELLAHASAWVREEALQALSRTGGADVVEVAMMACDDPDVRVRDRAAKVLAKHAGGRAVTTLIRLCDTRHAAVAADALARIGDPRALPTLWHLFFRHPDKAARHAAGRGLARIEGPPQSGSLHDPRVKRAYMWLIGHKPDWNRTGLIAEVTATDALVRARVAEALGRLRDPSGAMYVRLLVADPDPRVRSVARAALRRLAD